MFKICEPTIGPTTNPGFFKKLATKQNEINAGEYPNIHKRADALCHFFSASLAAFLMYVEENSDDKIKIIYAIINFAISITVNSII